MPGRKQGTYAQTARVLLTLEYLASQKFGVFLSALAARFGVTERQLRRDLGAIETAGYHIEIRRVDNRSHVRLLEAASRPLLVTRRERFVLLAARGAFEALHGTTLHAEAVNVFDKLAQQLSADARSELGSSAERLVVAASGPSRGAPKAEAVDALIEGALERRLVRARFRGDDGKDHKTLLAVYGVTLHDDGAFVIAHRLDEPRATGELEGRTDPAERLPLERFTAAELVGKVRFTPPRALKQQPAMAVATPRAGRRATSKR